MEFYGGIVLFHSCHNNVVQNSLIGAMRIDTDNDGVCVGFTSRGSEDHDVLVEGTRIVNNEIFNCNDGFQPVEAGGRPFVVNYPDTIVANNEIYITNELYSDGAGNRDPDGVHACAENAIDIKQGSLDSARPMIIADNRMWGYRRTDTACAAGSSGSWGSALGTHFGVQNLIIRDNVIFDSARGINLADTWDSEVRGNVIHSTRALVGNTGHALLLDASTHDVIVDDNIITLALEGYALPGDDLSFTNNVLISAGGRFNRVGARLRADFNRFYDTEPLPADAAGANDESYATAAESGFGQLCMNVRHWTSPERICLDYAEAP